MTEDLHQNVLPPDYQLLWYRIKRVLGRGSFGITYLAHDVNLDRLVAIKEYLPGHLSLRVTDHMVRPISSDYEEDFKFGLSRFISEGRTLTRFEHPNLVRVFNAFEANNTAYMVMNYEIGESLHEYLKRNKSFSEMKIMQIITPLLDGLQKMHVQGFIHRDIKPGNIFIRAADGCPVMLDFGSARQIRQASVHSLTNLVSPGYAPIEQYTSNSDKQGPWTDIYGLGATIYKVITGSAPLNAVDRGEAIMNDARDNYIPLTKQAPPGYSNGFLAAIDHALMFKAGDRPQSVTEWLTEFQLAVETNAVQDKPVANDYISMINLGNEAPTEKNTNTADIEKTLKITTGVALNETPAAGTVPKKMNAAWSARKRLWMPAAVAVGLIIITGIILTGREEALVTEPVIPEINSTAAETNTTPDVVPPAMPGTAAEQFDLSAQNPQTSGQAAGEDEVRQLLAQADTSMNELRLTTPQGNNAHEQYEQVLAIDPGNEHAQAGIHAISDKYVAMAYNAIKANKTVRARLYISKAGEVWPESEKIGPVNEALEAKLQEISKQQEEQNMTGEENTESVADLSPEQTTAETTREGESGGLMSGVKKWLKEDAEKNKSYQQEKTGDDFVKSIGGTR